MSTTSRILIAFLVVLAIGLYIFDQQLNYRVERQYLEAAEESMVDIAQLLAARLEAESFDIPACAASGQRRGSANSRFPRWRAARNWTIRPRSRSPSWPTASALSCNPPPRRTVSGSS